MYFQPPSLFPISSSSLCFATLSKLFTRKRRFFFHSLVRANGFISLIEFYPNEFTRASRTSTIIIQVIRDFCVLLYRWEWINESGIGCVKEEWRITDRASGNPLAGCQTTATACIYRNLGDNEQPRQREFPALQERILDIYLLRVLEN